MMQTNRRNGFSLVEIAIVLAFIGLLIGAVLKGEQILDESRLMATMTEATAYSAATDVFKEKYGALPGDMPNARDYLNFCDDSTFCQNGNGDKYIGDHASVGDDWDKLQNVTTMPEVEATMFWKHLALAKLISGVQINADPANFTWKVTHPASRMRQSGWEVLWVNQGLGGSPNHFLRLERWLRPQTETGGETSGAYSVSTEDAMEIDTTMDDGNSLTGKVQAQGASGDCLYSSEGLLSPAQKNCYIFFRLEMK